MVPEKPQKKEMVKIDYLVEMRKNKENPEKVISRPVNVDWEQELANQNLTTEEKSAKIREKAEKIEKQARIQEFNIGKTSPQNHQALEAAGQVNDMIISSIKAKLALLQHVTGK